MQYLVSLAFANAPLELVHYNLFRRAFSVFRIDPCESSFIRHSTFHSQELCNIHGGHRGDSKDAHMSFQKRP